MVQIIVIIAAVIAMIIFAQQSKENRRLWSLVEECLPSRYLFLVGGAQTKYMEKFVKSAIKARKNAGVSITASLSSMDKGSYKIYFNNGEIIQIQRVDLGLPEKMSDFEEYHDYVFADYQIAPDLLYKALDSAGLRNMVYSFSILDEKGK